MDETFTCTCQMKTDLENSADVFSFFEENYQNIKKGFRWKPLFLCRQVLACSIK